MAHVGEITTVGKSRSALVAEIGVVQVTQWVLSYESLDIVDCFEFFRLILFSRIVGLETDNMKNWF